MTSELEIRPLAHQLQSAVRLTGISRSQLYELIKHGELPIVKVGRRTLIADDDLRSLLCRHRVAGEIAPQQSPSESDASAAGPRGRRALLRETVRPNASPPKAAT
jgi:excisionase family DNA binding protein